MNIFIENYNTKYAINFDTHGGHPGIEIYERGEGNKKLVFRAEVKGKEQAANLAKEISNQFLALSKALEI